MNLVGVFGGTFDPVHFGHLRTALEMCQALVLQRVHWIPCRQPPHRPTPQADDSQRVRMLRAALRGMDAFILDERELRRAGPSYMVDTLESLHAEAPDCRLCLMLGMDAYRGLSRWHRPRRIVELAHLLVAHRPGSAPHDDLDLMQLPLQRAQRIEQLQQAQGGRVWFQQVTQLEISASHIRRLRAAGKSPRYLLPEAVLAEIQDMKLYTEPPAAQPEAGETLQ